MPTPSISSGPAAFRWESCDGFVGVFRAPLDTVRAAVPPAFVLDDVDPASAGVIVRGERCQRAASDVSVHPEIAFLAVLVRVHPVDASWGHERSGQYVLDVLVTDAAVAKALVEVGIHAQTATVTISKVLSLDPVSADVWAFNGDTLRVSAPVARGRPTNSNALGTDLWFDAGGAFRRVDASSHYTFAEPLEQAGPLTLQGSARSARIFPTGTTAWESQAVASIDEIWTGVSTPFIA